MIEGHTIDVFLADKYRLPDSFIYKTWFEIRGLTAPIFMFTAGLVFTYLLLKNNQPFKNNPRVKKGLKRFGSLIFLGYLLRFPTANLFNLANLSESKWRNFFVVDALHLIGMGLLTILFLIFLTEKFKLHRISVFIFVSFTLLIFSPITSLINFASFLPLPIAAYFNSQTGSFFPLFPWLGFVTSGAVLGLCLWKNKELLAGTKLVQYLFVLSAGLFSLSHLIYLFAYKLFELTEYAKIFGQAELGIFRLSVVLFLSAIIFIISRLIKNIPPIILKFGRYSLSIYIVHLIILYGSVVTLGINNVYRHKSNPVVSVAAALVMIFAMGKMTLLMDRFKSFKKRKLDSFVIKQAPDLR